MTDSSDKLVELGDALRVGRISSEELLDRLKWFPEDAMEASHQAICRSLVNRDRSLLEAGLAFGFHFGFLRESCDSLAQLLLAEWHRSHEDMADVLGDMKCSTAVPALIKCAFTRFDYLDYDDSRQLHKRCIASLKLIGTEASLLGLNQIQESGDVQLRELVQASLNYRGRGPMS